MPPESVVELRLLLDGIYSGWQLDPPDGAPNSQRIRRRRDLPITAPMRRRTFPPVGWVLLPVREIGDPAARESIALTTSVLGRQSASITRGRYLDRKNGVDYGQQRGTPFFLQVPGNLTGSRP